MRRRTGVLALLAVLCIGPARAQDEQPAVGDGAVSDAAAAAQHARMRDPFRPFTLDMHPEAPIHVTPLQRFEIGQLTVVATVWEVSPPLAMVEDSFGMGYIITPGTPIGPNGGVVTAIEPQRVVVEEHVLDFYGKEQINQIVMETPKEEPNQPGRERK